MIWKILKSIFVALCLVTLKRTAQAAYIDPNTGGMLFQILAVMFGFLSGLILIFSSHIRKGVYRILRLLRSDKTDSTSSIEDQAER